MTATEMIPNGLKVRVSFNSRILFGTIIKRENLEWYEVAVLLEKPLTEVGDELIVHRYDISEVSE